MSDTPDNDLAALDPVVLHLETIAFGAVTEFRGIDLDTGHTLTVSVTKTAEAREPGPIRFAVQGLVLTLSVSIVSPRH